MKTIMRNFAQCCFTIFALYTAAHAAQPAHQDLRSLLCDSKSKHLNGITPYPVAWAFILNDIVDAKLPVEEADKPLIEGVLRTSRNFLDYSFLFKEHFGYHGYTKLTKRYRIELAPLTWKEKLTGLSISIWTDYTLYVPLVGFGLYLSGAFSSQPECPTHEPCEPWTPCAPCPPSPVPSSCLPYLIKNNLDSFKSDMQKLAIPYNGMGMIGAQPFGLQDYKPRVN